MGYMVLMGGAVLAGMVAVGCGFLAGRWSNSTWVASLISVLTYFVLLLTGCWLLYLSIPPDPVVHAQATDFIVTIGGFSLLVGGGLCAAVPVLLR